MSDLTITTAGQSESKVSGGEFLSSEKKLNQMKVVLTEGVNPTCDTTPNYAAGDLFFNPIRITASGNAPLTQISCNTINNCNPMI